MGEVCHMDFFFHLFFHTEEALKCNTNFGDAVEWCINKHDDAPNGVLHVLNGAALGRQAAKKKSVYMCI